MKWKEQELILAAIVFVEKQATRALYCSNIPGSLNLFFLIFSCSLFLCKLSFCASSDSILKSLRTK